MPQTFQVLRCYKCEVFQVHPTKKSNKWKCKLCDEKQTIKRFYGLGTGKECRLHVQKLNGIRSELDSTHCESDTSDHGTVSDSPENPGQVEIPSYPIAKKSKWLDYVDTQAEENPKTEEEQVSPDTILHLSNAEVVLELPKKHPKKCHTVTTKIVNKSDIKCLQEIDLQPAGLLNNNAHTNFIKSMELNKANIKTCKTNPTNNVQTPSIIANNSNPTNNVQAPAIIANNSNSSKWAKFVVGTQNCNDENDMAPITCTYNQTNSMFPFLEDDDIDSVLDF